MRRVAAARGILLGLLLAAWGSPSSAEDFAPDAAALTGGAFEIREIKHDVSPPLREVTPVPPKGPQQVIPLRRILPGGGGPDGALQSLATFAAPSTSSFNNFLGVGVGLGSFSDCCAPPDTNGAPGATQYVQWVNLSFAVFDKSTGNVVYGPAGGNTLWTGFGGPCETNNSGDPIALYDKAAGRWVLSQPVFNAPYYQCFAVSTTSDATGTYTRYAFNFGSTNFPDYPKISVWPDAYYYSANIFANGSTFRGAVACAFDRNAMLAGTAATMQCFFQSPSVASLLPSDLDGPTAPPSGSPNYFLNFGSNSLNLFQFHVDFTNSANSTFTGPISIPVASFGAACNGGACIPQAGTRQTLDSLGDRLMYRLSYRNFGSYESLLVNHSVTAGTSVGVRWYELRSPQSPVVYQQGTYAPDATFRWMGSIAQDHAGNIALGYSASSSSINPGIRFAARAPGDPLGTLGAETTIIDGTGSQLRNLSRWGDYSAMTLDPVDDCTFWYTSEYLQTSGTFNWSTRIANFKFAGCGTPPDFSLSATPSSQTVTPGSGTTYTVNVTPSNGFTGPVTLSVTSALPPGVTASFNPNPVAGGSGSSTLSVGTGSSTPTGGYTLTITGTNGTLTHSTNVTLVVNAPPTPDFSISASPSSQTVAQGNGTSYTVTVGSLNGYSGAVNLSVTSALPAGVTVSFSPNPVTGGSGISTLSVTTTSSTPAGSYTVTITGTDSVNAALTHSISVTLVVTPPPDFSISASPASQSVSQGGSTAYSVTISPLNGFTGSVTLGVSGLPSTSDTASFSPNPTALTSTLTVGTVAADATGSYTLTITGTSGSLSHSTTVTLNVTPPNPDFSLTVSPASQSVVAGTSVTYSVTIGALNGFAGSVSLSVNGLPQGSTGSFSPNPAGSTSTLTVATSTGHTGSYPLTITGTSGSLSHSTSVTLVISQH